ncbi:hypothetical protein CCHR01_12916 [Colletotrichum chrysophilum]|uniref:Uncharacterized protein n=1 Tax=Colletotrichum chrysophilum TaxID=1836956 RepID=A0AAD9EDP1_9PEZI|nr:hypothetical protein CCHR01_12916 [Colletotrichum chrysophilum]
MGYGRRRGMLRRRKWHLPCPQGRRSCSGEWGWHIGRPKRGVDRLFRERWAPFGRVDWSAPQHLTAPRDPPIHTENTGRHRRGDRGGTRGPPTPYRSVPPPHPHCLWPQCNSFLFLSLRCSPCRPGCQMPSQSSRRRTTSLQRRLSRPPLPSELLVRPPLVPLPRPRAATIQS